MLQNKVLYSVLIARKCAIYWNLYFVINTTKYRADLWCFAIYGYRAQFKVLKSIFSDTCFLYFCLSSVHTFNRDCTGIFGYCLLQSASTKFSVKFSFQQVVEKIRYLSTYLSRLLLRWARKSTFKKSASERPARHWFTCIYPSFPAHSASTKYLPPVQVPVPVS
jgi:hypothetical protein